MECVFSEDIKMQREISRQIDRRLKMDRLKDSREIKILLLGTGESGKSTFIKQMRIIHGSGYTDEDRRGFIQIVHQNVVMATHALIRALGELMISFEDAKNQLHAATIMQADPSCLERLERPLAEAIESLWRDRGIQYCYGRRREFQMNDTAKHYLDDMERITAPDYLPSLQDVLLARIPTTGINEYTFSIETVTLRMVDVGGQRSERRKWIHCFEKVSAIMFLVAVNEYDQSLPESTTIEVNRLEESKALYSTLISSRWFERKNIILFLNKIDLLREKIQQSHLSDYFPAFSGPKQDEEAARAFILDMFLKISGQRVVYPHFTCATDTENIRFVFKSVQDTLLQNMLDEIGLE